MLAQGKEWSNAREGKIQEVRGKTRFEKVAPNTGKKYRD
jgi:hypothetical protein